MVQLKALLQCFSRLSHKDFQQERKFCYFNILRVYIHAVNVVQQDAFPLGGCKTPFVLVDLIDDFLMLSRILRVFFEKPIE